MVAVSAVSSSVLNFSNFQELFCKDLLLLGTPTSISNTMALYLVMSLEQATQ